MPGAEVSFGLIKPAQPATLKITEEEVDCRGRTDPQYPWPYQVKAFSDWLPSLRSLWGRMIGIGPRPEHIHSPKA